MNKTLLFLSLFILNFSFLTDTLNSSEDNLAGVNIECNGGTRTSINHIAFKFLDEKKVETRQFILTHIDQATGKEKVPHTYKEGEEVENFYDFYREDIVNYNTSKYEGRDVVYIDLKDKFICSMINGKIFKCNKGSAIMRDNLATNIWNFNMECDVVDDAFANFTKYKTYRQYEPQKKKNLF